jgi:sulfur carrier protein
VTIHLNGARRELGEGATVAALVQTLARDERVAVAVNGVVVRRAEWPSTRLVEGDVVEVLGAVAGG